MEKVLIECLFLPRNLLTFTRRRWVFVLVIGLALHLMVHSSSADSSEDSSSSSDSSDSSYDGSSSDSSDSSYDGSSSDSSDSSYDGSSSDSSCDGSSDSSYDGSDSSNEMPECSMSVNNVGEDPNSCQNDTQQCDPAYPYRMINGSCNNLYYPNWGMANECYVRFLPAYYDGFGNIRKSTNGGPLPEPRILTLNIFQNLTRLTTEVSFMFTIYGQTVAHDGSLAMQEDTQGDCCSPEFRDSFPCLSIAVPENDPFYSQFNVTCLSFVRTLECTTCDSDSRQQSNGATATLDASIVYGADDERAGILRTNDGTGRMIANYTEEGELLPTGDDPNDIFCYPEIKSECFFAGDIRVNQHSTLTSLQTLFVREHNRIATILKILNPHWDDERLYQESRKINIAQLQSITYGEYLPYLLGPSLMEQFNLTVLPGSEGTQYDSSVRLGMWNEFATAVFRLHSMVAKKVGALGLEFKNLYSNPELLRKGHMGQLMKGVCKVASEMYDRWFVTDVTEYLYQPPSLPYGGDLSATDIQRGRDHGLAPYVHIVRFCTGGNVVIKSFDDLAPGLMPQKNAQLLQEYYATVEDVDLWAGVQMEYHLPGSEVGATAACILAKQFHALKFGDRFYFEHVGEAGSFTAAQRKSLKKSSLSRLLCDNTRIRNLQKNAMLLPSDSNRKVSCYEIPRVDLRPWKEDLL
ncbi:peroxidase [Caerostris darwini]|uniref:Peroxidase n=1 Tax=Caerostris darwini TaxID=1538125 RepID=A0AAV4PQ28_9ARAC|nr:peroxidase [Caerostris darwini]